MVIRIPDTLTIDNSENYIMSIRLQSDGLSISGYIPSVAGSFFYRETACDSSISAETLKDFFFAHDFLTWKYKQIRILVQTPIYTLIPKTIFDEKESRNFLSFNFVHAEKYPLTDELNEQQAVLAYGMDNEIYEFCSRSFIHPRFIHTLTPLISYWGKENNTDSSRRMYAVWEKKDLHILCFQGRDLLLVNSFTAGLPEDAMYYILYAWRQAGMEQEKDHLYLWGEAGMRMHLTEILRVYLRHIEPTAPSTEAYLKGGEIAQAPMDLIALLTCES